MVVQADIRMSNKATALSYLEGANVLRHQLGGPTAKDQQVGVLHGKEDSAPYVELNFPPANVGQHIVSGAGWQRQKRHVS